MSIHTIQIFRVFERIWHWSQVASIFILVFTGFAIYGAHRLIDFKTAVTVHTWVALALLLLWAFATFWLFTTGQWRQYLPTGRKLFDCAKFYAYGIFKGEEHPYTKTYGRKHNPLQALTYLFLKIVIFPAIWMSGIAYLMISFGVINKLPIEFIALVHVIAAIAIVVFIIAHVYLLTTGHSFREHVRPMITGFDEVELTDEQLAFLKENEPHKFKK